MFYSTIETIVISGDSISQIDDSHHLSPGSFLSTDLFLVSQQCLSNVSPNRTYTFNGETLSTEYQSVNEMYNQLSNQVLRDISARLGFKSMAWEDERWYSLVNHIHNYSRAEVSANPELMLAKNKSNQAELSAICMFNIDSKKQMLYMPKIHIYESPKPYIGQLKFLAVTSLAEIPNTDAYYNSPAFDGWVYPDGRSLSKTVFKDAFAVFGTTYGGTADSSTFNIPKLDNFMKNTVASDSGNFAATVPERKVLIQHYHDLDKLPLSGSLTTTLSIGTCDNTEAGTSTHSPNNGVTTTNASAKAKLSFNWKNVACSNPDSVLSTAAELDVPTFPTYNLLPVLMYVGNEKT